jgi:hypothetical protein
LYPYDATEPVTMTRHRKKIQASPECNGAKNSRFGARRSNTVASVGGRAASDVLIAVTR